MAVLFLNTMTTRNLHTDTLFLRSFISLYYITGNQILVGMYVREIVFLQMGALIVVLASYILKRHKIYIFSTVWKWS